MDDASCAWALCDQVEARGSGLVGDAVAEGLRQVEAMADILADHAETVGGAVLAASGPGDPGASVSAWAGGRQDQLLVGAGDKGCLVDGVPQDPQTGRTEVARAIAAQEACERGGHGITQPRTRSTNGSGNECRWESERHDGRARSLGADRRR